MTLVSMALIDRLGRRTLLLSAQAIMCLFGLLAGLSDDLKLDAIFKVIALLSFVAGFGIGLGNIPWLILPELVPGYAVGPASSVCAAINWTSNFILALIMPPLLGTSMFSLPLSKFARPHLIKNSWISHLPHIFEFHGNYWMSNISFNA